MSVITKPIKMYFMLYSNKFAVFCKKYHSKIINFFDPVIELYSNVNNSGVYNLPLFHYTQVNNLNLNVIIDDILDVKKLKGKNNNIYYYIGSHSDHNIHCLAMESFMQELSGLIADPHINSQLLKNVYNFTKDITHV